MVSKIQAFQLYHLIMIISLFLLFRHRIKWYMFNLDKPQSTITTGTKYFTLQTPQFTYNLVTHVYRSTHSCSSNSPVPNADSDTIIQYSQSRLIRKLFLLDLVAFKVNIFCGSKIRNLIICDKKIIIP